MTINFLNSVNISPKARTKILSDFFSTPTPSFVEETETRDSLQPHSGALCLYSATLISKIHETNPEAIQVESNERELALQSQIQQSSKFSHLTDEKARSKAHEMILKDIRNSFAHGNFTIAFINNDLYFVLQPKRKDFVVNTPIIISSCALKGAIIEKMSESSASILFSNESEIKTKINNNLSSLLKGLMLPSQLLKIADYYLENSQSSPIRIDSKRKLLIEYTLLVTQITYEQDDYYNIFGKDSSVFDKVSLIRNSIAHDNFLFGSQAKNISHTDRNRNSSESISKGVTYLDTVNALKNSILTAQTKDYSQESIDNLKTQLAECLDMYFNNLTPQIESSKTTP